jgi:hypothetical protein
MASVFHRAERVWYTLSLPANPIAKILSLVAVDGNQQSFPHRNFTETGSGLVFAAMTVSLGSDSEMPLRHRNATGG